MTVRGRAARGAFPSSFLLVAVFLGGCGHDVAPTAGFRDPASIPVCCVTDFAPGCCDIGAASFAQGIVVSWTSQDSVFAYIDGWAVYRARSETEPLDGAFGRLNDVLLQGREYVDRDVENEVLYWYRLSAVSPAGVESLPTRAVSARVDMTPPAPPTGLAAVYGTGGVALDWNPSPEPDRLHYNVFREPPVPPAVYGPVPADFPSYLDTFVSGGTTYRYWVTAVDLGFNESAPSETVEVAVP